MKILIIDRKWTLGLIIALVFVGTAFTYVEDFGNMMVGVMNKERVLPIYCVDTDEKKIAISFDAAWGDQYTKGILDILDKNDIKATFFLVGFWVDKYPDMVKKISEAGHDVGNHSSTHPHMTKLSSIQIAKELNETGKKIEEITGKKPFLFRPPFGDYNDVLIETAKENGYYTIQWDVDSLDWKELGAKAVVDRVTRNAKKGSVVLFHNNAKYVLEYLPQVLERLQREGYEIVPISELIIKEDYYIDNTGMQKKRKQENTEE